MARIMTGIVFQRWKKPHHGPRITALGPSRRQHRHHFNQYRRRYKVLKYKPQQFRHHIRSHLRYLLGLWDRLTHLESGLVEGTLEVHFQRQSRKHGVIQ